MKNGVIAVLVVLVLGMGGFLVYDKLIDKNEQPKDDKVEENGVKATDKNSSKENDYQIFAENLKNQISKVYNETNNGKIYSWIDKYYIEMDKNRSLYITYQDAKLNEKFGKYKLADNILSYYIVETGQGGGNVLYFINEDGTVGDAGIDWPGDEITIRKDIGYKNIVAIIGAGFYDDYSGIADPIFIDINGNMYATNLHQ